jgi:phage terminase large subunit-like protein
MTGPIHRSQLPAFAKFCSTLTLDNGAPMRLEPFQRVMLGDYFAGVVETLILIPKKNGKSTLLAALALFHLTTTDDAECIVAAASRDQATILYDQAAGFVRRSYELTSEVKVKRGYREIQRQWGTGRIRVLAADADTADGVIPTLALVDELHRHKSAELYGVFRDGLGPRHGRMVTISTADENEDTPLGELRAHARNLPLVDLDGRHLYARDGSAFAMHEWALLEDDDRDDMQIVKLVNPGPWQTPGVLAQRHDSPSTTSWQWARFACGLWVRGQSSAISPTDWSRCRDAHAIIADGAPAYLGLDLGWTVDTTALTPLLMDGDERRIVGPPVVLQPPGDGSMIDERAIRWAVLVFAGILKWDRRAFTRELGPDNRPDVVGRWADAIGAAAHPLHLRAVVYDPNAGGQQLVQQLERQHGLRFVAHSQDNAPMALASMRLADAIPRALRHNGDPLLRQHVLTAVQRWLSGEKWKYDRPKGGRRQAIDALTGLLFAHSVAVAEMEAVPEERPKVEVLV